MLFSWRWKRADSGLTSILHELNARVENRKTTILTANQVLIISFCWECRFQFLFQNIIVDNIAIYDMKFFILSIISVVMRLFSAMPAQNNNTIDWYNAPINQAHVYHMSNNKRNKTYQLTRYLRIIRYDNKQKRRIFFEMSHFISKFFGIFQISDSL